MLSLLMLRSSGISPSPFDGAMTTGGKAAAGGKDADWGLFGESLDGESVSGILIGSLTPSGLYAALLGVVLQLEVETAAVVSDVEEEEENIGRSDGVGIIPAEAKVVLGRPGMPGKKLCPAAARCAAADDRLRLPPSMGFIMAAAAAAAADLILAAAAGLPCRYGESDDMYCDIDGDKRGLLAEYFDDGDCGALAAANRELILSCFCCTAVMVGLLIGTGLPRLGNAAGEARMSCFMSSDLRPRVLSDFFSRLYNSMLPP